jgi:hypothetical protein
MLHSLERRLKARLKVEQLEARNLLNVSTNVLVNNTAEDATGSGANVTQSETTNVVANDGEILVGFNDSEENLVAGGHFTSWSNSADGGKTFTDRDALPTTKAGDAGDPTMAINKATGTIYFQTLSLNVSNAIQLFRSTDNGHTFTFLSNSGPGFNGTHTLDKDWLTVDNSGGLGQGLIYSTFTDFPIFGSAAIYVDRSLNGTTWTKTKLATGTVQGSNVVVGADESVYVAWLDGNASSNRILIRKALPRQSFRPAVTVATLKTTPTANVNGDVGLDFRTDAFPILAANPKNANQLFCTYTDVGKNAGDRCDAYFTMSNDGGTTWTTPVVLNSDSAGGGTADQWFPTITVSPDGTHLFSSWYDRRLSGPGNGNINREGVIGTISGSTVTFGANFRIDDATTNGAPGFPEVFGNDAIVVGNYMGDYDTSSVSADGKKFYTSWVDNRLPSAQDVFFASVDSNTGTGVVSLVVHGLPDTTGVTSDSAVAAVTAAPTQSLAYLTNFVAPSVIKSGGGSAAAVATKKVSNVDQVFAANVLIGSGQFQGYHHANQGQDDGALWHFGTL